MKNIILILISFVTITVVSCSTFKKTDVHSKEEIMKMDAYAFSELKCKAEYLKLMSADSAHDINLQNKSRVVAEDKDEMAVYVFHKYYTNHDLKVQFESLTEKLGETLTVCKKLEEYIILQEAIKNNSEVTKKKK